MIVTSVTQILFQVWLGSESARVMAERAKTKTTANNFISTPCEDDDLYHQNKESLR
jgi:hypothetical protein